jgi:hypothetical protein
MVFMAGSADSGPELPALWSIEARKGNVLLAAKKDPLVSISIPRLQQIDEEQGICLVFVAPPATQSYRANVSTSSRDSMTPSHRHGKRSQLSTAAFLAFGLIASLSFTPKAEAQTASGLMSTWGKACKMRVVEQFDVPMSDAVVNIGATEKQSIDDGTTSAADIKKRGMSYNWEIRGKKISGYCNVNGKGTITEFKQGI